MPLRIKNISVRTENSHVDIELKNVTVLVGPSNSGKSELLRDISKWLQNPLLEPRMKILSKINDMELPGVQELESLLGNYPSAKKTNNGDIQISIPVTNYEYKDLSDLPRQFIFDKKRYENITKEGFQSVRKNIDYLNYNDSGIGYLGQLFRIYLLILDAQARFSLVESKKMGDLLDEPLNYMVKLYHDDVTREKISKIIKNEFGYYIYLLPHEGTIKILLDRNNVKNSKDLSESNLQFFKKSKTISDISDGTRAFLGIILAFYSLPHKIILVDDPEAFLHPPLAKNLGRYLSRTVVKENSSLFVSTHSVDFLMGCLEETQEVTIIRLTYDAKGRASKLPFSEIEGIMKNPLLRSNHVLDAVFHKSAIVVEGNSDRIFFNEINLKILGLDRDKAIVDPIFINSDGKHVIHQIVSPLKQINIPVVSIYDFDILDEREENKGLFERVLRTNLVKENDIKKFVNIQVRMQQFVIQNLKENEPDPYRKIGVNYFPKNLHKEILHMINRLRQNGIFINPNGPMEKWLQKYNITGKGNEWVVKMLDKIKDVSVIPNNDVWKFVDKIRIYIYQQL